MTTALERDTEKIVAVENSSQWRRLVSLFDLTIGLSRRDILSLYRGSLLGFTWSFISPLFLLVIYTFIFGVVLKNKWPGIEGGIGGFAVMLFCGLIPFNFFNEALSRGSKAITNSPNFVKRIAFPTIVLPLVTVLSSLFHACMSLIILMVMNFLFTGALPLSALLVPVVMLPIAIFAFAANLVCATVGVFIRDVSHLLGILFSMLLFASPIFYPATMFPAGLQWLAFLNPIAYGATNLRKTIVLGEGLHWASWSLFMLISLLALALARAYHQRLKARFADVL